MKFCHFQWKHFFEQSIWICKWVSWWCNPSLFSIYFAHNILKMCHYLFLLKHVKACPHIINISEQTLFCIYSVISVWTYGKFYFFKAEIWNFNNFLWTKLMENCEAMTWSHHQLRTLFAYIDCSRNVLLIIMKIQNENVCSFFWN